jgi:hypothetical protein
MLTRDHSDIFPARISQCTLIMPERAAAPQLRQIVALQITQFCVLQLDDAEAPADPPERRVHARQP